MVHASSILAAVLSCSSFLSVSASPVDVEQRAPNGGALDAINWRGTVEAGKPPVYLSGRSFEHIEEQAKVLNPAFTIFAEHNATEAAEEDSKLSARAVTSVQCKWPPNYKPSTNLKLIADGIKYLEGIKGDCRAPAGPGGCARVSCEWSNAIFFCNDNPQPLYEPCKYVAAAARKVVDHCALKYAYGETKGQAFVDRGWNAIVAQGNC